MLLLHGGAPDRSLTDGAGRVVRGVHISGRDLSSSDTRILKCTARGCDTVGGELRAVDRVIGDFLSGYVLILDFRLFHRVGLQLRRRHRERPKRRIVNHLSGKLSRARNSTVWDLARGAGVIRDLFRADRLITKKRLRHTLVHDGNLVRHDSDTAIRISIHSNMLTSHGQTVGR